MIVSISMYANRKKIRETKWFELFYVSEEFKPGKSNHMLDVLSKSGEPPLVNFSIVIEAGGDAGAGESAVVAFAKKLPDTVDASYLKSYSKKQGLAIIED